MTPEGLIASIRQRLMNLARENGEAFDFVLARYGIERFLYRLSISKNADCFVLKGSMLFHVWNRKMHRPTRDLDLLLKTDPPERDLLSNASCLRISPRRNVSTNGVYSEPQAPQLTP